MSPSKKYNVVCGVIKPNGEEIRCMPEIFEVDEESRGVTFDRAKQTAIEYLQQEIEWFEDMDESSYRR